MKALSRTFDGDRNFENMVRSSTRYPVDTVAVHTVTQQARGTQNIQDVMATSARLFHPVHEEISDAWVQPEILQVPLQVASSRWSMRLGGGVES